MGSSLDPVAEVNLTAEDLKASNHVSVGWGKKETQFQGRGAKALRDPTIPEKVDQGLPSSYEDGSTSISWRGDGAYVAVNSVQQDNRRVIRVYSREGELDSASEPVDGLEASLSWRPSGNLIAGIQRLSDRTDVVFFERNGLRHGQFTLVSPRPQTVESSPNIQLEWNSDSTVLAVILKDTVQLWTTGNYHWYLKQEIPKPSTGTSSSLSWHPEKALRFAVVSSEAVLTAELALQVARGSCHAPNDTGAVAVIDGSTLKLTPFRTANIPPPYSMYDLDIETSIIDVAFSQQNTVFVVLHHGGVDCYEWPVKDGRAVKPVLIRKIPFTNAEFAYFLPLRITAINNTEFRCTIQNNDEKTYIDVQTTADTTKSTNNPIEITCTATYDGGDATEGYGQDNSGQIYKLSTDSFDIIPTQFSIELPWFEISILEDGSPVAFGLSRNGHLYADSRLLAKNCTSFVLTPEHLVFTTSNHLVKYIHLTEVYGKYRYSCFPLIPI